MLKQVKIALRSEWHVLRAGATLAVVATQVGGSGQSAGLISSFSRVIGYYRGPHKYLYYFGGSLLQL